MVDLRPVDKQQGGFSLDGRQQQAAPAMKRREKIRVMLFLLGTGLFIILMLDVWLGKGEKPVELSEVSQESPDPTLSPMEMVDLQRLPELPSYDEIKARAADVDALQRDDKLVRYHLRPIDDLSFAWARSQLQRDRDQRPLPPGFTAEDFIFDKIGHGRPVLASGTLVEVRESTVPGLDDERWYRLSLLLENEHRIPVFLHVLAPAWAAPGEGDDDGLSPGLQLRVVGRYMGKARLPTGGGATEEVPVVAASALTHRDQRSVTDLMALNPLAQTLRDATWKPDSQVLSGVTDYPGNPRQSVLERRPYYYLLGQVKLDASTPGVYAAPKSIEEHADALYQQPGDYRGQVFEVEGRVWDAWFDDQVSRDQPYGVGRVMRIWLWRVVYGVGDTPFRDLYELAVLAPGAELPKRGQTLRATGRFLKVHMYHRAVSQFQHLIDDEVGTNENVLFKFVVAPGFKVIPDRAESDYFGWKIAFLVISASFFLIMGFLIVRDARQEDSYKAGVRRLRESRRKLQRGQVSASRESGADAGTDVDPGEAPGDAVDGDKPEV